MISVYLASELTEQDFEQLRKQDVDCGDIDFVFILPEGKHSWEDEPFINMIADKYGDIESHKLICFRGWVSTLTIVRHS